MPTLDWIGKKAVINHHREVPYRLLKCDKDKSFGDPEAGNLLVQGDNLEALKALLPYYAGKVKCIYIDPPYEVDDLDVLESLIQLRDGGYIHPQALIAVERNSRVKEISWPDGIESLREKNYGQATIFYGAPTLAHEENG